MTSYVIQELEAVEHNLHNFILSVLTYTFSRQVGILLLLRKVIIFIALLRKVIFRSLLRKVITLLTSSQDHHYNECLNTVSNSSATILNIAPAE